MNPLIQIQHSQKGGTSSPEVAREPLIFTEDVKQSILQLFAKAKKMTLLKSVRIGAWTP